MNEPLEHNQFYLIFHYGISPSHFIICKWDDTIKKFIDQQSGQVIEKYTAYEMLCMG